MVHLCQDFGQLMVFQVFDRGKLIQEELSRWNVLGATDSPLIGSGGACLNKDLGFRKSNLIGMNETRTCASQAETDSDFRMPWNLRNKFYPTVQIDCIGHLDLQRILLSWVAHPVT